jgi:hypothetical protein
VKGELKGKKAVQNVSKIDEDSHEDDLLEAKRKRVFTSVENFSIKLMKCPEVLEI